MLQVPYRPTFRETLALVTSNLVAASLPWFGTARRARVDATAAPMDRTETSDVEEAARYARVTTL